MGESARLPPDAEETEGHAVRSAALAHSLGQRLGTSKPHEEHAGFGEDQDNSSFGPLLEFTVQSAEHTGFRDGKGGSQAQWWIPKSTAPSRGSGPLPLRRRQSLFSCVAMPESQNHRMFGVGRDLCGSSGPTPLPKQGHPEQAAQGLVQGGLEYLQRRRLHNLPGQPVPGLHHPQSEAGHADTLGKPNAEAPP